MNVNSDIIDRIKQIMVEKQLSSSEFADKIDVQRSSISHLLSGRNKPSLDFIVKLTNHFSDISIDWLLHGKEKKTQISGIDNLPPKKANSLTSISTTQQANLFKTEEKNATSIKPKIEKREEKEDKKETSSIPTVKNNNDKKIEKIVFFYKDGSFKVYEGS